MAEAALKDGTNKALLRAERLMSDSTKLSDSSKLNDAQKELTATITRLTGAPPALASDREQAEQMLAKVDEKIAAEVSRLAAKEASELVQKQFDRFIAQRSEALFRNTQFTGLLPATNLELTRKGCRSRSRASSPSVAGATPGTFGDLPAATLQRPAIRGARGLLRAFIGPC